MINNIKLKFGSSSGKPALETDLTPITVFVGPNNSGKSKLLSEIEGFCNSGLANQQDVILDEIIFSPIDDIENEILIHTIPPRQGEYLQPDQILFGVSSQRNPVNKAHIRRVLSDVMLNRKHYCEYYVRIHTLKIGGVDRIKLVAEQAAGDFQVPSRNAFQTLFKDIGKRHQVRRIVYDAIGSYFIIDPSKSGYLRIRLSERAPVNDIQECGLHQDALDFQRRALEISLASDGVKAFVGIITTIIAGDPKIILIDEPEAFLHPSLAFVLGKEVSRSVSSTFKNLFVSTHSSNFLMGCIQSGVPINIVRLTYSNNVPTARILPSEKVQRLMRHPLLRSTGVLNGLFYEYVIVTEGDSDRAFYQEINERLLAHTPDRGIPNCLFLNAQNKQTVHEILRPLREMGIPCAAIVDIDVIKEGGTNWSNLLSSADVPRFTIEGTATSRSHLKSKFGEKGIDYKKHGGVDVLDDPDKRSCNDLFDQLEEYGIFVVRNGELESWLKSLISTGKHGPDWLIEIFEKLGEDPSSASYVKPSSGDVWDFIYKIKNWFFNSNRKGIPE